MAKSPRNCKITDEEIYAINLELCHIGALVELLSPEADSAGGPLVSGLMLIGNQVEKIEEMLEDVGRPRKSGETQEQQEAAK